jgi:AbrB family looped-hinge helix DNA binding protein
MNAVVDKAGQVIIPAEVRERLGLSAGSTVDFVLGDDGRAYIEKIQDVADRIAALRRLVSSLKTEMTTDEIMAMTRGED